MVPLLVCGVIQIDVDLEVGLLEDELDEHALLFHILLVQLLQLQFLLSLFLPPLVIHFINLGNHRFYVLVVLLDLVFLLPNLQI